MWVLLVLVCQGDPTGGVCQAVTGPRELTLTPLFTNKVECMSMGNEVKSNILDSKDYLHVDYECVGFGPKI